MLQLLQSLVTLPTRHIIATVKSFSPIASPSARSSLRACVALALLLVYLSGSFSFNSFHALFHSHATAALHNEKAEHDACHKRMYHGDKNACKHRAHVAKSIKCSVCSLTINATHLFYLSSLGQTVFEKGDFKVFTTVSVSSLSVLQLQLRGPPAV